MKEKNDQGTSGRFLSGIGREEADKQDNHRKYRGEL